MTNRELDVYLLHSLAGKLRLSDQGMVFQYETAYLATAQALPLSLSLPLQTEPCDAQSSRHFFANLLPEGAVREVVARRHHLSPENDFDLLAALGGDCAGAVSLFPHGRQPDAIPPTYRPLSDKDLERLAQEPFIAVPSFEDEGRMRLSLAGAQDKLPVALLNGKICLPQDGAPSTHILKPQNPKFPHLVENETFCLKLAARLSLPVPTVDILPHGDGFFLIERYDRRVNPDGGVRRIHQEDFCQALGVPHGRKYEAQGGPGFADCFNLALRSTKEPLPARKNLLRWAVFNYLIGNADAHAKNLSLLYLGRSPILAPFYDLVCTAAYAALSPHMAMAIGGAADIRQVDLDNWRTLSLQSGDRKDTYLLRLLAQMAREAPPAAQRLAREMAKDRPCAIYQTILEVISARADILKRSLASISESA
ncbi:type II toxin-antitoxin system HipA family toxin [Geoalkalibacter sp.]|uniref:type II toxin-antitoxin system HipA family toxin n=1 Tax=Geoalkalibacter sp. TaxID=3041440 RepID=UPI00272DE396|nr:type II toxin-antitoxin system HipA family toxin [Geoalkalibacter sp.]